MKGAVLHSAHNKSWKWLKIAKRLQFVIILRDVVMTITWVKGVSISRYSLQHMRAISWCCWAKRYSCLLNQPIAHRLLLYFPEFCPSCNLFLHIKMFDKRLKVAFGIKLSKIHPIKMFDMREKVAWGIKLRKINQSKCLICKKRLHGNRTE